MKITKEELTGSMDEPALDLFLQGIKAEATKKKYTRTLKKIVCDVFEDLLEGNFEQRTNQLVKLTKENPKWATELLLNLSKKLRARTELQKDHSDYLNPSSFDGYFKPLKKLLDMNDVTISWKRIYATFPEIDNSLTGRGWTRQEIQRMLNFANGAIDRAIILIAASSAIRSGGFDLSWEDVTPCYYYPAEQKIVFQLGVIYNTESNNPNSKWLPSTITFEIKTHVNSRLDEKESKETLFLWHDPTLDPKLIGPSKENEWEFSLSDIFEDTKDSENVELYIQTQYFFAPYSYAKPFTSGIISQLQSLQFL